MTGERRCGDADRGAGAFVVGNVGGEARTGVVGGEGGVEGGAGLEMGDRFGV